MTYAAIIDAAAPPAPATPSRTGDQAPAKVAQKGLLVHLARSTHTGFQVLEARTSQDLCQRYVQEIIVPPMPSSSASSRANRIRCRPSTSRSAPRRGPVIL